MQNTGFIFLTLLQRLYKMESESSSQLTSTYFSATIMSFMLGSSGMLLSIVPILIPHIAKYNFATPVIAELVAVGISTICVSAACWYLVYFKQKVSSRRIRIEGDGPECQERYMLYTLIGFGVGSILCGIMKLARSDGDAKTILLNFFEIVSMFSQLVFFYCYSKDTPESNRSGIYDYFIACLIGIQAWTWVSKALKPLWPTSHAVTHHEKGFKLAVAFAEEFLEPFYVEFATIAIGSLFNIWHAMKKPDTDEHLNTETIPLLSLPYERLLDNNEAVEANRMNSGCVPHLIQTHYMKISALGSTILTLICAVVILVFLEGPSIVNGRINVYIYQSVNLAYNIPICILTSSVLLKLNTVDMKQKSKFLNGSEYVLLFTACCDSCYNLLKGIAGFGCLVSNCNANQTVTPVIITKSSSLPYISPNTSTGDSGYDVDKLLAVFYVVCSAIVFLQVWLQVQFLIIAKRKPITRSVRVFLIFLSIFNLGKWLVNSILIGLRVRNKHSVTPIMDGFYGKGTTDNVFLILVPIMVLFRFHSAVVGFEIIKEG